MFDSLYFDPAVFDTGTAVIRPTLGGWSRAAASQPNWAMGDIARGTAWASPAKAQAKWAAGDLQRGTAWTAKNKGQSTW